ncbi:MAG: carbon storage regulator [Planctomycetes bacterium]|nr:carbon storage regulator [Planctomycetota bacterium]
MLVLSRKVGEKLQIGDGITVIVTRIAGNRVTLGVSAPANVRIVRSELKPLSELALSRSEMPLSRSELPLSRMSEYVVREPGPVTVDVSSDGVTLMAARRAR